MRVPAQGRSRPQVQGNDVDDESGSARRRAGPWWSPTPRRWSSRRGSRSGRCCASFWNSALQRGSAAHRIGWSGRGCWSGAWRGRKPSQRNDRRRRSAELRWKGRAWCWRGSGCERWTCNASADASSGRPAGAGWFGASNVRLCGGRQSARRDDGNRRKQHFPLRCDGGRRCCRCCCGGRGRSSSSNGGLCASAWCTSDGTSGWLWRPSWRRVRRASGRTSSGRLRRASSRHAAESAVRRTASARLQ